MKEEAPAPLDRMLRALCIDSRHPFYVELTPDCLVIRSGGAAEHFGIRPLVPGRPVIDPLDFLTGLVPPADDHDCLPLFQFTDTIFAEVHVLRGEGSIWVILLDASESAVHQQAFQQQAHEMRLLYERELRLRRELKDSREQICDLRGMLEGKSAFYDMVGDSAEMRDLYGLIRQVAQVDSTVLIEGETGTGKELVARALHDLGNRRAGPLIIVNCAGLSDALINSQLFGHRKGAFTDAVRDQEGLFAAADGGTIFLDEIGDIPMNTQTRVLRALEQREITRIGDTVARHVNIRILAATHKDLAQEVKAGRFREDLLYRIRVARIVVPPLRRRRQDIPLLIKVFLKALRTANGKNVTGVQQDTLRLMMEYAWPGNVRELRNAVEFAYIRCLDDTIRSTDLPPEILAVRDGRRSVMENGLTDERERLVGALRATGGKRNAAARLLGISRATFYRRLSACLIDPRCVE